MAPKHLLIALFVIFANAVAQSDDELHIPVENDNQFPPDNNSELDLVPEGSGANAIEEPLEANIDATKSPVPLLEDVQLSSTLVNNETETKNVEHSCPTVCVCNIEGNTNNYIVDCSNGELTELPQPIDLKTTELNLENNKLTEIPQAISKLKNLKILNVHNNQLMDVKAGSISELPELTSLKLGNNRLIDYPIDLKNSFGLTKLEEIDLGGNDMRTALTLETFSIFKALKKLTLPSAAVELAVDLCASLKESLQTVCIGSCSEKSLDCPDAPHSIDGDGDDLMDFALPGLISVGPEPEDTDPVINKPQDIDPVISKPEDINPVINKPEDFDPVMSKPEGTDPVINKPEDVDPAINKPENIDPVIKKSENIDPVINTATDLGADTTNQDNVEKPQATNGETSVDPMAVDLTTSTTAPTVEEPSFRSAVMQASDDASKPVEVDTEGTKTEPNDKIMDKKEDGVVGAATSTTKTGGVDTSIIAVVVAGMVLIVAGITIKKNWSSIRNRFSSSPRNANERANGAAANGTTPEEVPLQEKSPV